MDVCVIGLGYIGLPTALLLAKNGVKVHGVDNSSTVVRSLRAGEVHIKEPFLADLLSESVNNGMIKFSDEIPQASSFIISVPTPILPDKTADLHFIKNVCESLAPKLKRGDLLILESTSPVGTLRKVEKWLRQRRPDLCFPFEEGTNADVKLAYCPERILPGFAIEELVSNDRIIGGVTGSCCEAAKKLYRSFGKGKLVSAVPEVAEMSKLAENTFRDVNIAFANELESLCINAGINVWEVIRLVNKHPRVNVLNPGPGVGGHCISVDPWFLHSMDPDTARIVGLARTINDNKPIEVLRRVSDLIEKIDSQPVFVACLGMAFKKNVDDLRNSPAKQIIESLSDDPRLQLLVVEPFIKNLPSDLQNNSRVRLTNKDGAINKAHIILILVDHDQFIAIDQKILEGKLICDTRGIW